MNIKEYYLNNYPSDELGVEIRQESNFAGLINELHNCGDIYAYIGVYDSLIRERIFSGLSEHINVPYEYIYKLWLKI
jgi:hypothetical protein